MFDYTASKATEFEFKHIDPSLIKQLRKFGQFDDDHALRGAVTPELIQLLSKIDLQERALYFKLFRGNSVLLENYDQGEATIHLNDDEFSELAGLAQAAGLDPKILDWRL
jgi:hypothetical protein